MTRICIIRKDRCNLKKCNFLCASLCPVNRAGKECITEVNVKARLDESLCNGCGICSKKCPFSAVSVLNLPGKLKEQPIHRYAEYGSYNVSLEVTSEYGCSDSQTVSNAFSGSEYYINFPNAFIPNMQGPTGGYYSSKSDEDAQVFHPAFSGISDYQLKIFSKLGILIFESSDINIGWDGYLNGKLCEPGVYIWKVRGSFRNGEPFTKMGDVTLLRN